MARRLLATALLLASACISTGEISDSLSSGLMPGTGSDPTTAATTDGTADDASSGDTAVPPTCSDGVQGEDETDVDCGGSCEPCDNGQGCLVAEDCSSGVCEGEVCISPTCGNGSIETGEACDDAGESAACNEDCTAAACGDGVLNATAGESCDEAGESASCNADCTVAACGDGVLNATAGEVCDDAGESASCNADCTMAACGDGVLNVTAGEACDDAGDTAACDADCTAVACGDGATNPAAGEACDDAGESATCDVDCSAAECGDATVNATAGEECDGGPAGDCGPDCLFAGCQPDPVALALAACMADYPSCDIVDGGVVGYGAGSCTGCNCGLPASPWRFYCTATSDASNYNCSACIVGEVLGPHDPCNCNPGTSPVLDTFCME
jgi:hypothetical protein